jgi:hypothetical protein
MVIEVTTIDIATTLTDVTITASQAGATYQWVDCNRGNAAIPGATAQSFAAIANGQYAVIITLNSCSVTSSCVTISSLGIEGDASHSALSIYPNPASLVVNISTDETVRSVRVIDILGKSISVTNFTDNKIDVSLLQSGVYFVEIKTEGNRYIKKFIKE